LLTSRAFPPPFHFRYLPFTPVLSARESLQNNVLIYVENVNSVVYFHARYDSVLVVVNLTTLETQTVTLSHSTQDSFYDFTSINGTDLIAVSSLVDGTSQVTLVSLTSLEFSTANNTIIPALAPLDFDSWMSTTIAPDDGRPLIVQSFNQPGQRRDLFQAIAYFEVLPKLMLNHTFLYPDNSFGLLGSVGQGSSTWLVGTQPDPNADYPQVLRVSAMEDLKVEVYASPSKSVTQYSFVRAVPSFSSVPESYYDSVFVVVLDFLNYQWQYALVQLQSVTSSF
jgi:hypothetical protein